MYHIVVEATLAQPGQHFIEDYLVRRGVLPAFRAGMRNVALDEQRHIGFGVKLLADLKAADPEVPAAVADLLREVLPSSAGVLVPPGWDRSYTECFGFTTRGDLRGGRAVVSRASCGRRDAGRHAPARSRTRSSSPPTSARSACW